MTNMQREIGRLEAVAESLKQQNEALREDIAALKREISDIKDLVAQIRGGSKVVFWIGGLVSGGVGAALFKFIPLLAVR